MLMVCRSDSPAELELIRTRALEAGADAAVVSNHWALGGAGAKALAEAVVAVCEDSAGPSQFKFTYELDVPIAQKIEAIAREIYRADGIELSELAKTQVENYERQGYGGLPSTLCLPICVSLIAPFQFAWPRPSTRSRTIQS